MTSRDRYIGTSGVLFDVINYTYKEINFSLRREEPPDLVSLNGCRETGDKNGRVF